MPEPRRSGNGNGSSAGRSAGGSRSLQSRRLATRPGAIPRWAYIALIAIPSTGIVILLAIKLFRGGPEAEAPPPVDENVEVTDLEKLIPGLEKEYKEVQTLLRSEDARAKARVEELQDRMYKWIERWDKLFDAKRDENGQLPPPLQGYNRTRFRVNQLLSDLNRSAPF